MRNANYENTSKSNFKRYGTVCAGFLCPFFEKRAIVSKKHKERMVRGAPRIINKELFN